MGTKGVPLRRWDAFLVEIDGETVPLHRLPRLLSELETRRGEPLTVVMPPTLTPAAQRLLATLGVRVVFDQDASR